MVSMPDIREMNMLGRAEETDLRICSIEHLHLSPEIHLLDLLE